MPQFTLQETVSSGSRSRFREKTLVANQTSYCRSIFPSPTHMGDHYFWQTLIWMSFGVASQTGHNCISWTELNCRLFHWTACVHGQTSPLIIRACMQRLHHWNINMWPMNRWWNLHMYNEPSRLVIQYLHSSPYKMRSTGAQSSVALEFCVCRRGQDTARYYSLTAVRRGTSVGEELSPRNAWQLVATVRQLN